MSSIFSNNSAATLLQGSQSTLQATQQAYTQAFTQNANLDVQNAALTEQSTGMQANQAALEGATFEGQQAQAYNNSGVLLSGSPMKVLSQTRQLAQQQVNNIIAQGQLTSQSLLQQGTQTLNQGYASILGQNNSYLTQLAQAKIGASNNMFAGFGNDASSVLSFLGKFIY
jgi:hypothetical protein